MTAGQQTRMVEYFETIQQPWNMHCIKQFRCNVPHAKIVIIPNGHHYCFIKQEDLVFEEILSFLRDC
jgi:pimeloyl-ACP methyl ester carboxylesterase